MPDYYLLYSTFGNKGEALSAARALLEARLIACANVLDGATSLYRWEGAVQEEAESLLIAKTGGAQLSAAIDRLATLHSYALPCIVAVPIEGGHAPFLAWVGAELGQGSD